MQTKITASAFFVACVFIGSCGITEPYVDTRREAGKSKPVGESTPDNVVICYNSMSSTAAEIKKLARDECNKTGRKPVFEKQKSFSCTVLLPMRAYFKCVEKTAEDIAKDKNEEKDKITVDKRLLQIRSEIKAKQDQNTSADAKQKTESKEETKANQNTGDNDNTPEQMPSNDTFIMEDGDFKE